MTLTLHPVDILYNLYKYSFLLTLPLARFVANISTRFEYWPEHMWLDGLVVGAIILLSLLRWRLFTLRVEKDRLFCRSGIFFRSEKQLPIKDICACALEYPYVWSALGACRFVADTDGGLKHEKVNLACLLHKQDAEDLLNAVMPPQGHARRVYKPHAMYLLLLSLITSNGLAGVIIISTFIKESGRIVGEQFTDRLYSTFNMLTEVTTGFIPPAASALAWLMILGWLVALVFNMIRFARFTVLAREKTLSIATGLFTRRFYALKRDRLHFTDIRRNLFTIVTGSASVFVCVSGYGSRKGESPVIIPAEDNDQLSTLIRTLFPTVCSARMSVRAHRSTLLLYLTQPLILMGICVAVYYIPPLFLPLAGEIISFAAVLGAGFALFFGFFRLFCWRRSGFGCTEHCLTLCCYRGLYLHTVIVPFHEISSVVFRQPLFLRKRGLCSVTVVVDTKRRQRFTLAGVPFDAASEILKRAESLKK